MWANIRGYLGWSAFIIILLILSHPPLAVYAAVTIFLAVAALASAAEERRIKVGPLILFLGFLIQRLAFDFFIREGFLSVGGGVIL